MDEEKIKSLISIYQELPQEMQCAVLWILEHIDIVDYLAQGEETAKNEIEDLTQRAIDKKDYLMVAMLVYKRVYDLNN